MIITATSQTVLAAAIVALALIGLGLLLAHHVALEARDRWAHRRTLEVHRVGIELCRARTAAHEARKRSTVAHDEDYAAQCRAERDEAHRLAVQLVHHNDQLKAELDDVNAKLTAATNVVHRQNRASLHHLARVIAAEETLQLPVVPVSAVTRELPAIGAARPDRPRPHHDRRRALRPA